MSLKSEINGPDHGAQLQKVGTSMELGWSARSLDVELDLYVELDGPSTLLDIELDHSAIELDGSIMSSIPRYDERLSSILSSTTRR